jgi:hypothetical protein
MHDTSLIFKAVKDSNSTVGTSGVTPSGLHYIYLLEAVASSDQSPYAGIFGISLPFVLDVHLVGIPKNKDGSVGVAGQIAGMSPVQLEGDYDSYFSLYVAGNEQLESRIVLDPAAMEYSIDFCSKYTWELVNNTLYFASEGILPDLSIADEFVRQITPAQPIKTGIQLRDMPQTIEKLSTYDSKYQCPICKTPLREGRRWLACVNGHGYMIKAADIVKTRQHMDDQQRIIKSTLGARPSVLTPITIVEHGDLHCPNDESILTESVYQLTIASLYTCSQCIFRWIDGQDLDTILGVYRNDGDDNEVDENGGDI